MLGIRLSVGKDNPNHQSHSGQVAPLGAVRLMDASSARPLKSTSLSAYKQIYEALGVTNDRLAQWETENGYWSFGKSKTGQLLIPGFPVFSKVAWMYIEPVDLSPQEVEQLIAECARAEAGTDNAAAKEQLYRIRALAEEALSQSVAIRFDQP